MPTYTETNRITVQLADNATVFVVTYDETDEGVTTYDLMESQYFSGTSFYCWKISNLTALQSATTFDYFQVNAAGAIPKPKGSSNPGGSPVKY